MTANAQGYNSPEPFYNGYGNPNNAATAQNPQIVPPMGPVIGTPDPTAPQTGEVLQFVTPAQFLAAYPRIAATATVTLTGTATAGDTCFVELANGLLPGGSISIPVFVISGDTLTTIGEKMVLAINSNATLMGFGVFATQAIVGSNPVVTISWPGPAGNFTAVQGWSFKNEETATIGGSVQDTDILTITAAGAFPSNIALILLGGTATQGDVITLTTYNPQLTDGQLALTYTVGATPTLTSVAAALATAINGSAALTALGMTANGNYAQLFIQWNASAGASTFVATVATAATETLTVAAVGGSAPSALAPSPAPSYTVTVGGTTTTGDIMSLEFTSPGLGGPYQHTTVLYTVASGDTTTTILAASIAAAINANTQLAAAPFVATSLGAVITITWNTTTGSVGLVSSVAGVPTETFAITVAPQSISTNYTVVSGDSSTTNIATHTTTALNANVALKAAGFYATSSSAVISIFYSGELVPVTFSKAVSAGAEVTVTLANVSDVDTITVGGSATTGDTLNLLFKDTLLPTAGIQLQSTVTSAESTTAMATALAAAINGNATLGNAGITATSSSAVVTVVAAGPDSQPTITAWPNGTAETATLAGTVATGDIVSILFTNALLSGGSYLFNYKVLSTDTTATILAASVSAAINTNATLEAIGVATTHALGVVTITWPVSAQALTFTGTANGSETATFTGTATNGEIPQLVITDSGLPGGASTYNYTEVVPSDTNTTIAAAFAALIVADTGCQALNITATSTGPVLTIVSGSPNATTYSKTNSTHTTITLAAVGGTTTNTLAGGPTETLTVSAGGGAETVAVTTPMAGGHGAIIPTQNFTCSICDTVIPGDSGCGVVLDFFGGKPVTVGYATLAILVRDGLPII